MHKRKITEMVIIAVPAILESFVAVIITSIDTKMISVLGKPAISAVSLTNQPKYMFFSLFFALGTSASMFISHAYGKRDREEANSYLRVILHIALLLSIAGGFLLALFARPIMTICSRQADTLDMSVTFFRTLMFFSVFQAVSTVLNSALRGIGKTSVTLKSNIVMGIVDIIVNYLLIEGNLGFPRLEVLGDAIGTVAGTASACALSLFAIVKEKDSLGLDGFFSFKKRADREVYERVRDKARHIIIENLLTRMGFLLSGLVISTLHSSETAVYFVGMILLNCTLAFGDGLQSATVALTGKSMGAAAFDDLKEYARIGAMLGFLCSLLLSIIYIASARWFFGLYFEDNASLLNGVRTSYIAALLTFLQIIRIVRIGTMRGMGEVKDPEKIATVCVFILSPLLSLIFTQALKLGVWGIWLATVITQIVWFTAGELMCRKHIIMITKIPSIPTDKRG